jgi:hypothetical protein
MATKAELFRAESQRTRHEKPKAKKAPHVNFALHTDTRNLTERADKDIGVVLEDSMTGVPSRMSTRKSSHHGRTDIQIIRTVRAKNQSAKARAERAQVARKK